VKRFSFIFPGQGAQYIGMGHDFYQHSAEAKRVFEEADDLLKRSLSKSIFTGSEEELKKTKNSQPAIYVTSLAMLATLKQLFPHITPFACAGLSLGEYTAHTAAKTLPFQAGLDLVQARANFMHEACDAIQGGMAVVLGLSDEEVEAIVQDVRLPNDLWAANFNCPGQVVLSGTLQGIKAGTEAVLAKGAKKVIPLEVHGAFHSGLMQRAAERLQPYVQNVSFQKSSIRVASNVHGLFIQDMEHIPNLLIEQITAPVRWRKAVETMDQEGCDYFIEIGCGKTLTAMNKRIGVRAKTISIEKIEDLQTFEELLRKDT
jgi:[acyl-carrier-protein] S-malonyltransferase